MSEAHEEHGAGDQADDGERRPATRRALDETEDQGEHRGAEQAGAESVDALV